MGLQL
jgi:hypothetical protein